MEVSSSELPENYLKGLQCLHGDNIEITIEGLALNVILLSEIHDASVRDILLPNQDVSHTKVTNRTRYRSGRSLTELKLGFQNNYRREWCLYVNHGYMPPIYPTCPPPRTWKDFTTKTYSPLR